MKITNNKIYTYASNLHKAFENSNISFPIKAGFYIQKNKEVLIKLAQEIEQARMDILMKYGTVNGDAVQVQPENIQIATDELNDLFNLEQEVNIYKISLDAFKDDCTLTSAQIEALMFMIDEE